MVTGNSIMSLSSFKFALRHPLRNVSSIFGRYWPMNRFDPRNDCVRF